MPVTIQRGRNAHHIFKKDPSHTQRIKHEKRGHYLLHRTACLEHVLNTANQPDQAKAPMRGKRGEALKEKQKRKSPKSFHLFVFSGWTLSENIFPHLSPVFTSTAVLEVLGHNKLVPFFAFVLPLPPRLCVVCPSFSSSLTLCPISLLPILLLDELRHALTATPLALSTSLFS